MLNIHKCVFIGEMEKKEQQIPSEWSHAWTTWALTWPVPVLENGVVLQHVNGTSPTWYLVKPTITYNWMYPKVNAACTFVNDSVKGCTSMYSSTFLSVDTVSWAGPEGYAVKTLLPSLSSACAWDPTESWTQRWVTCQTGGILRSFHHKTITCPILMKSIALSRKEPSEHCKHVCSLPSPQKCVVHQGLGSAGAMGNSHCQLQPVSLFSLLRHL